MTMVDGEILVNNFKLARLDGDDIVAEARTAARSIAERTGISGI
jgi:hypothetical protein